MCNSAALAVSVALSAVSPARPPQRLQRLRESGQQRVPRAPHEPDLLQRQQRPRGLTPEESRTSPSVLPVKMSLWMSLQS
uniref:Uncharacterized protein n=1 Tax=Macaca fascicularis TaxID=9541 RepID=Q8I003_MACFA|nr:hypothetical protein [Macaca fascicularis]